MYKRYYDGYATRKKYGELVVPENIATENATDSNIQIKECSNTSDGNAVISGCNKIISGIPFELDDLILIGILLYLLFDKDKDNDSGDDNNDLFVLLIVGLIIFSDIF